ncbi:MAG: hypothetical protein RI894_1239 [Bacteroidota bacterium]|jgi:tRNA nucleotidyltransferase/poly(A) polymerase
MQKFYLKPDELPVLRKIAEAAAELNVAAYVVGGFVRDRLLGRENKKDIDIVCVGSGIALAEAVAKRLSPKPKLQVYQRFGTAALTWRGLDLEFVGARKESYNADSRKPVVEDGTLDDDQNRRDFTINTFAVSVQSDWNGEVEIIDSFEGRSDLANGIIRTPLDPDITFSDDPLRMLRAIRFATQLGFRIDDRTFQSITKNASRIKIISQERVIDELQKIMHTPKPSVGFKLLFQTGLLKLIFPEVANLHGVEWREGIGHKDNFYHTLQVLDNLCATSDNIWLRWSALLHDIAKPKTKRFDPVEGWTFHAHEAVGAKWVPRIFERMKLPLDAKMKYVQKHVELHMRPIALTKDGITDSAVRRLLFDAGDDIDDLMLLAKADITSKNDEKVKRYLQNYVLLQERLIEIEEKDKLRNWQPPITGEIIMETFGIPPSREVGMVKNTIREAILEGDIQNNYDEAFALMLRRGAELGLECTI